MTSAFRPSNLDTSVQAGLVVSLHNIPATGFVCSHTTVIWTLGPREVAGRPTKGVFVCAHENIFLLHSKPGVLVAHHVCDPFTGVPSIGLCGLLVVFEDFTEHQLGVLAEKVLKHGSKDETLVTVGASE